MDADGDFVVAWSSTRPGRQRLRRLRPAVQRRPARPSGGEFRVNTSTAGDQRRRAVAMDADGDFVVAWTRRWPRTTSSSISLRPAVRGRAAPQVTEVFIDGTAWAEPFRTFLPTAGMGSAAYGYEVPGGAAQADELPWSNVNRVSIRFSAGVVQQDDLRVRGVKSATTRPPPSPTTLAPTRRHGRWDRRS